MAYQDLKLAIKKGINPKVDTLKFLKCFEGIIAIFGAGNFAKQLTKVFLDYGIKIDYYVVDKDNWKDGMTCCGKSVCTVEQYNILDKDKKVIVLGIEIKFVEEKNFRRKLQNQLKNCKVITCFEACWLLDYQVLELDYKYFLLYYDEFQRTYEILKDDMSKDIMVAYLNGRISGDLQPISVYQRKIQKNYDYSLLLGMGEKSGMILECGAYDGQTALQIYNYMDSRQMYGETIVALECDKKNYALCRENCKDIAAIQVINKGVYEFNGKLCLCGEGGTVCVSQSAASDNDIEVVSIDNEYSDKMILAILMDIEGCELPALKGSRNVIEFCHPALAVRVYHLKEDLYLIPQFISQFNHDDAGYAFYLRYDNYFSRGLDELTLYAIWEEQH